jgi:hypothetical protein
MEKKKKIYINTALHDARKEKEKILSPHRCIMREKGEKGRKEYCLRAA